MDGQGSVGEWKRLSNIACAYFREGMKESDENQHNVWIVPADFFLLQYINNLSFFKWDTSPSFSAESIKYS